MTNNQKEIEVVFHDPIESDYRGKFRHVARLPEEGLNALRDTKELHQFNSNDDNSLIIDIYSLPEGYEKQPYFLRLPKAIQDALIMSDHDEIEYVLFTR